jgi:hypothetical protein
MSDSLADDRVKYVAYGLVFTKPGVEQMMPFGEGSVIVKENMTDTEFLSFLIAKYMQDVAAQDEGKKQLDALIRATSDWKYVKVHFITTASWPPDPVEPDRRQAEALEALRARIMEGS